MNVLCKSSNVVTGECLSCYPGYVVSKGDCVIPQQSSSTSDPYCLEYQGSVCKKCS